MEDANNKPDRNFWNNAVTSLELFIKKQMAIRRAWGTFAKVILPSAPQRTFTVILEKDGVTEQFFLKDRDVAKFATTGSDLSITTDIRTALHQLEKRASRRAANRA